MQWDGNQPLIDYRKTLLDGSIDTHKIPKVATPSRRKVKKMWLLGSNVPKVVAHLWSPPLTSNIARPTFNGQVYFVSNLLHSVTYGNFTEITKALY